MFDEIKALWTGYLEGELSVADEARLVKALDSDDEARRYVLKDLEVIGLLRQLGVSNEGFIRSLGERMRSQNEGFSFLLDTARRLEAEKGAKPRRGSRSRIRFPWAIGMAVAAGIALVVLVGVATWNAEPTSPSLGTRSVIGAVVELRGEVTIREKLVKVGDVVRVGDWVETRADGDVVLAWVGERTRVELRENSECRMRNAEVLELRKGRLMAHVEKRSELRVPSVPFVVEMPYARAEVKGTSFLLLVAGKETRLEVTEGLVDFTRLSDKVAVGVAAGQYAVAAEGVELVALSIVAPDVSEEPWVNVQYKVGKIIFEDDFSKGAGRWIKFSKMERTGIEPSIAVNQPDRNGEGIPDVVNAMHGGKQVDAMVVDGKSAKNEWLCVRLKTPIETTSFVVECRALVSSAYGSAARGEFATVSVSPIDGTTAEVVQRNDNILKRGPNLGVWGTWRSEYIAVPSAGNTFVLHQRRFFNGELYLWGKESCRKGGAWHAGISVRNISALVDHVVIRELVPVRKAFGVSGKDSAAEVAGTRDKKGAR